MAKKVLRGKLVINTYTVLKERSKITNLSFHLKEKLEKEKWIKPKGSREKIIKSWMEISKLENRKTIQLH